MSAGMFFCESKFLNEIPFDPTLDDLFEGEEILTSVKFYTNGWDVFTPKENIIYHEYIRKDKPKYFIDNTTTPINWFSRHSIIFYMFNYL
jgi:UDP-GlcNAc:polypeptide alpha-N-acetylglucosaminyltransferase